MDYSHLILTNITVLFLISAEKLSVRSYTDSNNSLVITCQPHNASTHKGGNVTFSVVTNENASYKWQQNKVNLNNNSTYEGTNTSQLTIINCQLSLNNDTYRCIVTNTSCGVQLTSSSATLTVLPNGRHGWWRGCNSDHWDDYNNWDDGCVPDATVDVTIPPDAQYQPVVYSSVTAACHNLIINPGASLTVNSSGNLNVAGKTQILSDNTGQGAFLNLDNSVANFQDSVTIERYISDAGYHYISNAVNGATLKQINKVVPLVNLHGQHYNPNNPNYANIWKLDETRSDPNNSTDMDAWLAPSSVNEVMQNMRGYALVVPNDNTTLKISGLSNTLNNGNISINLTDGGNGFNFIGNPYASPVDWKNIYGNLSGNINGTIIFYNSSSQYYGAWGYYNPEIGSYWTLSPQ